jgi:hypothetical protein
MGQARFYMTYIGGRLFLQEENDGHTLGHFSNPRSAISPVYFNHFLNLDGIRRIHFLDSFTRPRYGKSQYGKTLLASLDTFNPVVNCQLGGLNMILSDRIDFVRGITM